MTPEQARALFLEHCQPGDRGTLERYGEKAAVAAILSITSDLVEALGRGPSNKRIAECKKTFAYEYFGEYEMDETQFSAVNDAERALDILLEVRGVLSSNAERDTAKARGQ